MEKYSIMFAGLSGCLVVAFVFAILALYFLFSMLSKPQKNASHSKLKRMLGFIFCTLLAGFFSILFGAIQGYQALTKEEMIATLTLEPKADEKAFYARMIFPDGHHKLFLIYGDEVMVDAQIVKWKNWLNILGLHTAYRLDRISGRYNEIDDEKSKPRSLYAITQSDYKTIAEWRDQYQWLSAVVDVEHGSASFVRADKTSRYQLVVTTTGLLLRAE